jgi:hypothetical protein
MTLSGLQPSMIFSENRYPLLRIMLYFVFAGVWGGKGEVHRAIFPPRNLMV